MKVDDLQTRYHGKTRSACSLVAGGWVSGARSGLGRGATTRTANRNRDGQQTSRLRCSTAWSNNHEESEVDRRAVTGIGRAIVPSLTRSLKPRPF
jgi:hypothetical protein